MASTRLHRKFIIKKLPAAVTVTPGKSCDNEYDYENENVKTKAHFEHDVYCNTQH